MESTQFVDNDNIFHIFYRIISSLLCISHLSRFSRLGIGGVILSSLTIATSYQLISSSTIHMLHNLVVDNIFHYVPYPSSTYSALFIEVLRIGDWRGDPQFVDNPHALQLTHQLSTLNGCPHLISIKSGQIVFS